MIHIKDDCVKVERYGKFETFKYSELEQHLKIKHLMRKYFHSPKYYI